MNTSIPEVRQEIKSKDEVAVSDAPCIDSVSPHDLPKFPKEAYIGVLAEFAELYSRHYESPKAFFYVDAITVVGSAISGLVTADFPELDPYTRLHVLKIGPSGTSKKSTSNRIARKFVTKAIVSDAEAIWGKDADGEGLKIISGAGSGEGVALALTQHKRVLLYFNEFDRFLKKASPDASILAPIITELFDDTEYSNILREHSIELEGAHLGFASNMPLEQFESSDGVNKLRDIGMWNRLLLVVGDRTQKCSTIVPPDDAAIKRVLDKLAVLFSRLVGKPRVLQLTDEAKQLWRTLEEVTGTDENATRLDAIGMRLLAILAFTSGKSEIDGETVRAVFAFLKYQRKLRELFRPPEGETPAAKMEEKIIAQLRRQEGCLKDRDLQRLVNAHRAGLKVYKDALGVLRDDSQIAHDDGKKQWCLKSA